MLRLPQWKQCDWQRHRVPCCLSCGDGVARQGHRLVALTLKCLVNGADTQPLCEIVISNLSAASLTGKEMKMSTVGEQQDRRSVASAWPIARRGP